MAFLDETGLAELWSLIKAEDNNIVNKYVWAKKGVTYVDALVKATSLTSFGSYSSSATAYADIAIVNGTITLSTPGTGQLDYLNGKYIQYNGKTYCIAGYESIGSGKFAIKGYEMTVGQETVYTVVGYVVSDNPNAYTGNNEYEFKGQLGSGTTQIATGSYTGTGTYGSGNKNSLTFDFVPKFVFVMRSVDYGNEDYMEQFFAINGTTKMKTCYMLSGYRMNVEWSGNTISWYSDGAHYQLNNSGKRYSYIAIG